MITATISTYNRERYLPGVLASLARQTLDSSFFEIVLVDNNSPGNTKEIFEVFSQEQPYISCTYHLETNQGLSYGRNRGIKEAKGKYITFIDDDAFLADDYLEKIYHYFEGDPTVAAIGSKILLHYEDIVPKWENKYLNPLLGYFNMGDAPQEFPKNNYPRGSNMSFRMEVFERIGDFNVALGRIGSGLIGGEEKDLFQRIYREEGMRVIYVPDALVYHCVPIERTRQEFIRRQGLGTGFGERVRVSKEGMGSTVKRFFIEWLKWWATWLLFVVYLVKGQTAKGTMIVKFRWWVSMGLFFKKKA